MGPWSSHWPLSWLKDHNALFAPAGSFSPVSGSGKLGKRTGTGLSKLLGPSVWTVMTSGNPRPGGSGPGNRSGGTGAMPTLPPRVPLSLNSELAGTVIETPAKAGLLAITDGGKVIRVSSVALTGCKVPATI